MSMQDPLNVEKLPTGQPRSNAPESGTYGEKQSLMDLKRALPQSPDAASSGPQGPARPVSNDPVSPQRSNRTGSVPGIPAPVMAETSYPGRPVDTPLSVPPSGQVVNPQQRRLQILTMLADSPHSHEATREWAQRLIQVLAG